MSRALFFRKLFLGCAAAALAALPAAGCARAPAGGPAGSATAAVSGKVFRGGKPLTGGAVRFLAVGDERSAYTMIRPDGSYRLTDVPLGKVKVCVDTSMLRRFPVRAAVTVPEKYRTFRQTDLTYTVQPGDQTYDIRLD